MKIFTYIVVVLVCVLIVFNITKIDFSNPFEGDSVIALTGIVALLSAVCVLLIFNTIRKISKKRDEYEQNK